MAEKTTEEATDAGVEAAEFTDKGTRFLFWTLTVVIVVNLVMVIGALVIFGP